MEKKWSGEVMKQIERWVILSVIDNLWMDHLDAIDDLREGIGLRGYGQLEPLVEYKNEAYSMFERLLSAVDHEIAHRIFKVQVQIAPEQLAALQKEQQTMISRSAADQIEKRKTLQSSKSPQKQTKIGRNDPCWCGSGKKWKKCHYPQIG